MLVHIDASGVCHSDLSFAKGNVPLPPPVILGHEGAGTVLEVGQRRHPRGGRRPRHRVVHPRVRQLLLLPARPVAPVRDDGLAHDGAEGHAGRRQRRHRRDRPRHLRRRDDGRRVDAGEGRDRPPDEQLALIGCGVTTGVGAALNTAQVEPGSTVAVIGCGGVGQSVIQGARIAGASRIFAIDPVEMKRKTAEQFGATDLIDPADGDPVEQVQAATGGRGADYAFEVIGLPETILQAYDDRPTGRHRGRGRACRASTHTVTFPAMELFCGEKTLLGCMYGSAQVRRDFPRFVHLVETGRLDIGSMVSRHIQLDEVNDAFRAMEAGEVIRSVIT